MLLPQLPRKTATANSRLHPRVQSFLRRKAMRTCSHERPLEALTWVEEPTLAHDINGHARIAREVRTPIPCGENWWGPLDMQHAVDANASDYMMWT